MNEKRGEVFARRGTLPRPAKTSPPPAPLHERRLTPALIATEEMLFKRNREKEWFYVDLEG